MNVENMRNYGKGGYDSIVGQTVDTAHHFRK